MVITGLVAFIWMYFGRLYLIHDPGEWRIAHHQLGYPIYIIPLIGVTHILGGVGLLIPNVPRLTEWVYAGLAINLLLGSIHNCMAMAVPGINLIRFSSWRSSLLRMF